MKLKNLFTIALICFLLALPTRVMALEYGGLGGKPAYPDPDNPRSKSIFVYTLEPSELKTDGVLIVNNTPEKKEILIYATDSQKSSDGSFACEQLSDKKDMVGSWIKLEKTEITLESSTNEIIPFIINIPDTVSVGEENGCILIQEKKTDLAGSGVSLSFRTGLRVVVTIPGEQIRELEIKNFSYVTKDNNLTTTKFEVKNNGNVSIDANIEVSMGSVFGSSVYTADNQYPILRGDTSVYNFDIPKPYWGGIFVISGKVKYDASKEAAIGKETSNPKKILDSNSYTIFVFPELGALALELVLVILIFCLIYFVYKRIQLRKQINNEWVNYKITLDDDINIVATRYNISWKKLAKANKLAPPYLLKEGMHIKVPDIKLRITSNV